MDMNAGMENINKVKFILENLPDWMRFTPRRITTKTYIDLTNDAKISVFYPSTIKSPEQLSRSLTIPILYVDKVLSTIKNNNLILLSSKKIVYLRFSYRNIKFRNTL